jgi:hypothetical protein
MPSGGSPALSGRGARVHVGIGRQRPIDASSAPSLTWGYDGRPVTSSESDFEHSSAPNVLLTSKRQGNKADSDPKEEGGPLHEDIEL